MTHFVEVTFESGDVIKTSINGTEQEVREYYAPGNLFTFETIDQKEYQTAVKNIKFHE